MAAYPSYDWLLTSDTDADGGVQLDRAQDGTVRGRAFFPDTKRSFAGRHILTAAQVAALLAFYESNKLLPVDIDWTGPDPGAYTVFFERRPTFRALGPDAFEAEVRLLEQ